MAKKKNENNKRKRMMWQEFTGVHTAQQLEVFTIV